MKNEGGTIDFSRTTQQPQQQIKAESIQLQQIKAEPIQIQAQSAQQTQHQQPSNIILVRGSRAENGQIILQNTHELLSLLSEDDKPVLLQHPRIKAKNPVEGGTILFQPASIKNATLDGGTILLQSTNVGLKKNTVNNDGSITLQQRINKNGTTDGTFLLQTLKRLDKSQSILVIRNTNNASTASIATTTMTSSSLTTTQPKILNATKTSEDSGDNNNKTEILPPKPTNVPLGCGEYTFYDFYRDKILHTERCLGNPAVELNGLVENLNLHVTSFKNRNQFEYKWKTCVVKHNIILIRVKIKWKPERCGYIIILYRYVN